MSSAVRVLVVDDDESILEFVRWALTEEDFQVETASNGARALEVLERWSPDVILLDMRMPVMNGWTFARLYRERYDRRAPILMLTAATDAARRASEIGAEGYLAKPFDLADLLETLGRYRE